MPEEETQSRSVTGAPCGLIKAAISEWHLLSLTLKLQIPTTTKTAMADGCHCCFLPFAGGNAL